MNCYDPDVHLLSDRSLVEGLLEVRRRSLVLSQLTDWEANACSGIPEFWASHGSITWKQRRSARVVLTQVVRRAAREREIIVARTPEDED